ncbi:MAG TPA: 16S rRNA (uracil(1498)-N(3))-methyltransferase [Candidatus Tenderia sp.]|nr:16S rRNA (uracil(1498)-N(3))-methyltransferase [Candidatus Tenderia sp.]
MRTPRIHTRQPLSSDQTVLLDDNAFNHAVRVLRLKEGDTIRLFNGDGGEFNAQLCDVQRKRASARLGAHIAIEVESPLNILVGQCVSRGEKMDYTIQKSVELGVSDISPLASERCGVQLKGERLDKKIDHWRSVVISACEQSGRNTLPQLNTQTPLSQWVSQVDAEIKLVLDPGETTTLPQLSPPQGAIALLVGPEGGLTDDEVALAKRHGFTGIRLGPRILRTETAALATLSAIQVLWGDFDSL